MLDLQQPTPPRTRTFSQKVTKLLVQLLEIPERKLCSQHNIYKIQMNWTIKRACFDRKATCIFTRVCRSRMHFFILILFESGSSVLTVNTERPWEISEIYCLTAFVFLTWPQKCRCQKAGSIKSPNHCCLRCSSPRQECYTADTTEEVINQIIGVRAVL